MDLRADLFAPGGALSEIGAIKTPVHLNAQLCLHWIGTSAVCMLDMRFAWRLLMACQAMGADLFKMDRMSTLQGLRLSPWQIFEGEEALQSKFKVLNTSPLGGAIIHRNTAAMQLMLTAVAQSHCVGKADAHVARLDTPSGAVRVDAWRLCGYLGIQAPLHLLNQCFGVAGNESDHQHRVGQALSDLLIHRDRAVRLDKGELREVARQFILAGAMPQMHVLRDGGVDPSWTTGVMCQFKTLDDLAGLDRLIAGKVPSNPMLASTPAPLHIAAQNDNVGALIKLIEAGADIQVKDGSGRSLVQAVRDDGRQELMDVLRSWEVRRCALDALTEVTPWQAVSAKFNRHP